MSLKADVEYAIQQHSAWKMKFRDFLSGKAGLDVPTISEPNHCHFGEWLEAEGRQLLEAQFFDEIYKLHMEFHHVAAEVIRKIRAKDFAGARSDIVEDGAFNQASFALVSYMHKASTHTTSRLRTDMATAEQPSPVVSPESPQEDM